MQYNAKVVVRVNPYMSEHYHEDELVSVSAETQDEAQRKIQNHFEQKSVSYSKEFYVEYIEFFTRID